MPLRSPNLFLVGAPRCGTTALYSYLREHPQVFMSPKKELHYFSTDLFLPPHQLTIRDERSYLAMFAGAREEPWLGEASPLYLYSAAAPEAIKRFNPQARVIITLRNPADMMYSMYCLRARLALDHPMDEPAPAFELAMADGPARLRGEALPEGAPTEPGRCLYLCYRELGRYTDRVARFIEVFGRQCVHIVIFDDFVSDVAASYERVCGFLGVDASFRPDFELTLARRAGNARSRSERLARLLWRPPEVLASAGRALLPAPALRALRRRLEQWNDRPPSRLNTETRRRLLDTCASDVLRLGELLDRDLTHWLG